MATLDVQTLAGGKSGTIELDPVVFEAAARPHLFHAEVRRQLAARRAGTHSTKNRSRVSGGGAKPYRQKGTGRARQGTTRAPQWAGGGVVFGPVPRKHDHKLNKKTRRAALRGALSQRIAEGAVTVVDEIQLEAARTRELVARLQALGVGDRSVLVVIPEADEKVERAARNLPWASALRVAGLNVYDVLGHSHLVLSRAAVEAIEKRLGGANAEEAS
ncbi:MAG: 50S ribosomal protein L4 [Myxococcales bacterium]|nr:50S ribosomal protein L4 [Myxococcales bacterium]